MELDKEHKTIARLQLAAGMSEAYYNAPLARERLEEYKSQVTFTEVLHE